MASEGVKDQPAKYYVKQCVGLLTSRTTANLVGKTSIPSPHALNLQTLRAISSTASF
jgi:hypothetical protein